MDQVPGEIKVKGSTLSYLLMKILNGKGKGRKRPISTEMGVERLLHYREATQAGLRLLLRRPRVRRGGGPLNL